MLNNISFTGRETMLTAGLEKTAKKAAEYVGPSKVYAQKEIEAAKELAAKAEEAIVSKSNYTSPFAPTKSRVTGQNEVVGKIINFFG